MLPDVSHGRQKMHRKGSAFPSEDFGCIMIYKYGKSYIMILSQHDTSDFKK